MFRNSTDVTMTVHLSTYSVVRGGGKPETLSPDETLKYIAKGEERILIMELVVNANPDKCGSLIEFTINIS